MTRPGETGPRALSGLRAVMILNYTTLPMSFLANVAFARVSALALGYASVVQLFISGFLTFFVLGGPKVFVRYVPAIEPRRRVAFLASYALVVVALFLASGALVYFLFPGWTADLLVKFGHPGIPVLAAVGLGVVVWAFCIYFLYGTLAPLRAAITSKSSNVCLLVAALAGLGPLRPWILSDPSTYVWRSALVVYALAAVYGVVSVVTIGELRRSRALGWYLPKGFWGVAVYTHLGTLVEFCYYTLSPYIVLLWMDVRSLASFHVATRFPVLLGTLPTMLTDVMAPELSKLDASGSRDMALRQAGNVIKAALVPTVPAALAFTFFAGDAMAMFNPEFRDQRALLWIIAMTSAAAPVYHLGTGALAAFGAFRSYLFASSIYLVAVLPLAFALVPTLGLPGAAWTLTLGTAVQQLTLTWVLRRQVSFSVPARAYAAWISLALAALVAAWIDPGRGTAALLTIGFTLLFALLGRVTPSEVVGLVRRLVSRS